MRGEGVRVGVRCIPRGGADRIDGVVEGCLRIRVAAPAADGAANEALLRLLASELGLPRNAVRLIAGCDRPEQGGRGGGDRARSARRPLAGPRGMMARPRPSGATRRPRAIGSVG